MAAHTLAWLLQAHQLAATAGGAIDLQADRLRCMDSCFLTLQHAAVCACCISIARCEKLFCKRYL